MAKWVKVARADEIAANSCKPVEVEDVSVLLVRLDDGIHALQNVCAHMDYPLHSGKMDGETVECPLHGAKFDVRTGAVRAMPAAHGVASFAVKEENGEVLLDADELAEV